MVDFPVVYGPNGTVVQFICMVDENGDPTIVSLVSGPITATDGAIESIGATTDTTADATVIGLLKLLSSQWAAGLTLDQNITVDFSTEGLATEATLALIAATISAGRLKVTTQDAAAPVPKGYAQMLNAAIAAAVGLTVPGGSTKAEIRVEGGNGIRWRDDGVNPTAAVGMPLYPGESLEVKITDLSTFKMIAMDGTTQANISFYG